MIRNLASRNIASVALVAAFAAAGLAAYWIWEAVAGDPGGPTWTAEFTNARGLLAGNNVLDDGAVVGRVVSVSLARNGTALVRFQLSNPAAAPRADAIAAIQPADLLGDNYLSLDPGAGRRLSGPIDTDHTVNAPRLDEVLDAFTPPVRAGLRELLFEGGVALDQRGPALARATVALRPAFSAASGVLAELGSQDGSLSRLVPVAQRAAAELDTGRSDIGPLLDGLSRTLGAVAANGAQLDAGIAGLPATLAALRRTATGLSGSATAAAGVARKLAPITRSLATATAGLPVLLDRARTVAPTLIAGLRAAREASVAAQPGLSRLAVALPTVRRDAPATAALMQELDAAAPGIAQGFFVDFPDQADESGRQPFDPFADPQRAYWRGAAVFSCEAFGVPVAPGCLTRALANLGGGATPTTHQSRSQTVGSAHGPSQPVVSIPRSLSGIALPPAAKASTPAAPPSTPAKLGQAASALLHFLLRP